MPTIHALVLRAAGINCDEETAHAWRMAGASPERIHVNRLIENPRLLDDYQILTIPGGFSYGDDIASGKVLGCQLAHHLGDALRAFVDRGRLLLGICNGFQVLVRMGMLPGSDCPARATLTLNDSGRYEDRWITVRADAGHCPLLERGETFRLPVAHGEGKIVFENGTTGAAQVTTLDRIALRYVGHDGKPPISPENPNGSIENAAALIDSTGRVLGMMPHPERNILATHTPDRVADANPENDDAHLGAGLRIFHRAVAFFG